MSCDQAETKRIIAKQEPEAWSSVPMYDSSDDEERIEWVREAAAE